MAVVVLGCAGVQTTAVEPTAPPAKVVVSATSIPATPSKAPRTIVSPETQVVGDTRFAAEAKAEIDGGIIIAGPTTSLPNETGPEAPTRPPRPELTPEQLIDRRLDTFDALEPPTNNVFVSEITTPAPADVIARSTWNNECPVSATDLSYAQVSFFGFDGQFHTGELLLHRDYAEEIVGIMARLHQIRFPIEEMRVVSQDDFENPIADENNTTVFTCRRSVSSTRWSRHAHGDAIDINPFHNPYVSSGRVIPELAAAYVDRERDVPGLVGAEVRAMFSEIGWGWGGNWNSVKDWMHFSATGR